jgi:hypothetical protein
MADELAKQVKYKVYDLEDRKPWMKLLNGK